MFSQSLPQNTTSLTTISYDYLQFGLKKKISSHLFSQRCHGRERGISPLLGISITMYYLLMFSKYTYFPTFFSTQDTLLKGPICVYFKKYFQAVCIHKYTYTHIDIYRHIYTHMYVFQSLRTIATLKKFPREKIFISDTHTHIHTKVENHCQYYANHD